MLASLDNLEYPMLSVFGKSVAFFVAYMAIFVDPMFSIKHIVYGFKDIKALFRFLYDVYSILLCFLEVLNKTTIKVADKIICLVAHFVNVAHV